MFSRMARCTTTPWHMTIPSTKQCYIGNFLGLLLLFASRLDHPTTPSVYEGKRTYAFRHHDKRLGRTSMGPCKWQEAKPRTSHGVWCLTVLLFARFVDLNFISIRFALIFSAMASSYNANRNGEQTLLGHKILLWNRFRASEHFSAAHRRSCESTYLHTSKVWWMPYYKELLMRPIRWQSPLEPSTRSTAVIMAQQQENNSVSGNVLQYTHIFPRPTMPTLLLRPGSTMNGRRWE